MSDDHRRADVRVGIFVLGALAILVVGSLWIAGSTILSPRRTTYRVRMQDSGGIQPGDHVRVAGVAVGKVDAVKLRPGDAWPVQFEIAVRRDVLLHTDGSARILTAGLVGNAYLQLDPGAASSPVLEPGGEIRGVTTGGIDSALARVDELGGKVSRLLDQATTMLDRLSAELGPILDNASAIVSTENASRLTGLLASTSEAMEQSGPRLSALLERLESVAKSAEGGTERLPELANKLETILDDLHGVLGADGSRLVRLLDTAQGSLESADDALGVLGNNREQLEVAIRDLGETAANLKAFSQTIKERPFSLIRVKPQPERAPGERSK